MNIQEFNDALKRLLWHTLIFVGVIVLAAVVNVLLVLRFEDPLEIFYKAHFNPIGVDILTGLSPLGATVILIFILAPIIEWDRKRDS
jgi:hypothetical protein